MKVTRFKKLLIALSATCLIATTDVSAQTTSTTSPTANQTIEVTSQKTTWIQVLQANGIDIPAGADGVVISNGAGGNITASLDAIVTQSDTSIVNAGNIAGGFNAINFVNGSGSGSVNNLAGGVISSDSRAINIGGAVSVSNAGQIVGTGNQRNGTVYSDSVANNFSVENSGTIDAGAGNQGSGVALEIGSRTTADIVNSGTIQGRTNTPGVSSTSGLSGDGVRLANFGAAADRVFDGTITNEASGVISSESNSGTTAGLRVANTVGFQGTLDNEGLIEGQRNGLYFGNPVDGLGGDHTGGVVNNSGRIESQSRALNIDGTGLQVNNSGSILGTGSQRNGTVYADSTAQDFSLNNSGSIDAGAGNEGAGFSVELSAAGNDFSINNSGTLAGRGDASAGVATAGDGIRLERTRVGGALDATTTGLFTGDITNSGTISSEGANGTVAGFRAVNGVDFQGSLVNEADGVISGEQNGVYFGNATPAGGGDHTGGVVRNEGTISSGSRALNIDGEGLSVVNEGDIIGTGNQRNGTVYSDDTANNFWLDNSGRIDAGVGNAGSGVSLSVGSTALNASIDNSGIIQGRTQAGTPLDSADAQAGDGLRIEGVRGTNADGSASFAPGVFAGVISNSGEIASGDNTAGTVAGLRTVNGLSFQGALNNTGSISGASNGLYFGDADHTGGVVNSSGVISSDSRAVNIDGTGLEFNNDGTVLGTGDQRNGTVYADSTAQGFTLNNRGSIDAGVGNEGAAFSAELSEAGNDFTINNSGELRGRGTAGAGLATAGDGIRLERTRVGGALDATTTGLFTGTINNSGIVTSEGNSGTTAGFRAVNGVDFQGTLTNTGTISGVQNGVYFGNPVGAGGGDHTGGVVNNLGIISSDSRAFNLDGNGLQVNNSGEILATGEQRNGTFYVDGTADNFTLNNSGAIDATGGSGSGLSVQVGSFTGDVQNGTVFNSGSIIGSGDSGLDAGIRLFSSNGSTTFSGDIFNDVDGFISADGSPAVLVQDGVLFDGSLINAGQIDGSVSLASGDFELLDTSLLSLTIDSLTDFDTVDIADNLLLGGALELNFADPFAFEIGQTFDLFDFGSVFGSFDSISSGPLDLDFSNFSSQGTVTIAGNTSATAVPEPSSFTVLALGGIILLRRRRK